MSITIFLVYRMHRRCKHLNCLKDFKVFFNLSSSFKFIFLFPKTICCYNSFVCKEWLSSYNYHLIYMDFLVLACFSKVANLFCYVCEVWTINLFWHFCVSYRFFMLISILWTKFSNMMNIILALVVYLLWCIPNSLRGSNVSPKLKRTEGKELGYAP
jgi:hypothetical protein